MHLDRYSYNSSTSKTNLDYEFESIGPKGTIRKVVRFTEIYEGIYNLGFGDLDESADKIIDDIVTNNGDGEKILITVATIADDFTKRNPNAIIFIEGSTKSRTRLYQINIAKYWMEINKTFEIRGLLNDKWMLFKNDVNYDAFLALRH